MTDQRDGILDPEGSETVDNTPELEAVRLWASNPTEDSWRAAHDALAPGKDKLDREVVEGAMHKYAVAGDDKAREKARAELFTLIANRQPIGTTTWGELGKAPPRDWLVTGWLPTGCVSILSGRGGVGKSRLALQLAAGVASGGGKEGEPDVWLEGPPDAANPLLLGTAVSNGGGGCPSCTCRGRTTTWSSRADWRRSPETTRPRGCRRNVWRSSTSRTWPGAARRGGRV